MGRQPQGHKENTEQRLRPPTNLYSFNFLLKTIIFNCVSVCLQWAFAGARSGCVQVPAVDVSRYLKQVCTGAQSGCVQVSAEARGVQFPELESQVVLRSLIWVLGTELWILWKSSMCP